MTSNFFGKNLEKNPGSKKSQISAFVIIGVIIVAGVIFYFLILGKKTPIISQPIITEPGAYIEKCAKDAASEAIEKMMPQGGYVTPTNFRMYNDVKIAYLCYTPLFYQKCTMQEPMYIKHLQDGITEYISPKIEDCFSELKNELEKENYQFEMRGMKIETELGTGIARVNIEREINFGKQGELRKIQKFGTVFNSPLYNLAITASEIANQEAKYCNFEYVGFMLLYPEFNIDKKVIGSGESASKIYLIKDRESGKELNIAIRSCAFPEGF